MCCSIPVPRSQLPKSWAIGGYWTHYGPTGWYLDAVVQGTFYDGAASTSFSHLSTDGSGLVASLEGGYPFPLPQFGPGASYLSRRRRSLVNGSRSIQSMTVRLK